jgi:hypothetical protein
LEAGIGDIFESMGAVVNRVHAGTIGQQGLCSANITGGSVSPLKLLFQLIKLFQLF